MRKNLLLSAALGLGLFAIPASASEAPAIGVVNFATCVTESRAGKKEQANMENMRKQMSSLVEDTEKELREIATRFEDPEYLDSLSPKAEEDLKVKYQTLQEDLGRYQNQFYQVLNHANYQMVQKINNNIAQAAQEVANQRHLDYVINKEACFFARADFDVTESVISEMDKNFEIAAAEKRLSENGVDLNNSDDTTLEVAE